MWVQPRSFPSVCSMRAGLPADYAGVGSGPGGQSPRPPSSQEAPTTLPRLQVQVLELGAEPTWRSSRPRRDTRGGKHPRHPIFCPTPPGGAGYRGQSQGTGRRHFRPRHTARPAGLSHSHAEGSPCWPEARTVRPSRVELQVRGRRLQDAPRARVRPTRPKLATGPRRRLGPSPSSRLTSAPAQKEP